MIRQPIITNFDALQRHIISYVISRHLPYVIHEDEVLWFVAMQRAAYISEEYRLKDIANLLIDGVEPLNREQVDTWLVSLVEEFINLETLELYDEEDRPSLPNWTVMFERHFGVGS